MKTLTYKGYVGSIEISDEDNCLFGKVLVCQKIQQFLMKERLLLI